MTLNTCNCMQNNGNVHFKKGDIVKNNMASLRSKTDTIVRRIPKPYKEKAQQLCVPTPASCGRTVSSVKNCQFCKELKIGVIPFPSIGLKR